MNKSAQAMLKSYKNEELLDLLIELKSELSNPEITLAPRQFTEDAEMLEVVQKEILKRMREGSAR